MQALALQRKGYLQRQPHAALGVRLVEANLDPFAAGLGSVSLPVVSPRGRQRITAQAGGLRARGSILAKAEKQEACLLSACTDDGLNAVGIRKGDFLVIEALPVHRLRTEKTAAVRVGEGLRARQFVRPCNTRFSCHLQTIATPR